MSEMFLILRRTDIW